MRVNWETPVAGLREHGAGARCRVRPLGSKTGTCMSWQAKRRWAGAERCLEGHVVEVHARMGQRWPGTEVLIQNDALIMLGLLGVGCRTAPPCHQERFQTQGFTATRLWMDICSG